MSGDVWRGETSVPVKTRPCSRCQQVSLMSPHPNALFPQCLCNKNPFRPVWRNVPETNKGPANPFICCWKEPGEEAYSSNPTVLFHPEVLFSSFTCSSFPGFILAEQKDHEGKEVYNPRQFVSFWGNGHVFLYRIKYIHQLGILEVFQWQRVCQFMFISHAEVKIWWEVNSQKAPHPSPGGRKQCIWSNLPEVSLRDLERWAPIYHH